LLRTDFCSDKGVHDCLLAADLVDRLEGGRVLIVGDIMLDRYLHGTVERISPEAPVPVVQVQSEDLVLGGAGNVARNIASLGGKPYLLSYRGRDLQGEQLDELVRAEGFECSLLRLTDRPTTTKTRIIANHQQVCRVDKEINSLLPGRAIGEICEQIEDLAPGFKVLILSDYGKGLIQSEFMKRLLEIVQRRNADMHILVDPKPKNARLYTGVTLLTPNAQEAAECGLRPPLQDMNSILQCGAAIFRRLKTRNLLITLGARGMVLFESPDQAVHIPTSAKKVFDVTGAGDTVIAVLGLCLSQGLTLLQGALLANTSAGIVVGQVGAAGVQPEELKAVICEQGAVSVEILK